MNLKTSNLSRRNRMKADDWKTALKNFQRLEKPLQFFPTIGKNHAKISNDWKPVFGLYARPLQVYHGGGG
jgi:hypothetical protein